MGSTIVCCPGHIKVVEVQPEVIVPCSHHLLGPASKHVMLCGECNISMLDGECNVSMPDGECNISMPDGERNVSMLDAECNVGMLDAECNVSMLDAECNVGILDAECNVGMLYGECNVIVLDGECTVGTLGGEHNVHLLITLRSYHNFKHQGQRHPCQEVTVIPHSTTHRQRVADECKIEIKSKPRNKRC